jgi:hypothetical protein
MLPQWENSQLVLHAAHGIGNWIGAASALIRDDYIYLAYRDRHPVEKGRGNRAYVARFPIDDGIHFETLCSIDKEDMDAGSLERPALDVMADGDWDLYLSCATYNSKHWRIERLRAPSAGFQCQDSRDRLSWQRGIRYQGPSAGPRRGSACPGDTAPR